MAGLDRVNVDGPVHHDQQPRDGEAMHCLSVAQDVLEQVPAGEDRDRDNAGGQTPNRPVNNDFCRACGGQRAEVKGEEAPDQVSRQAQAQGAGINTLGRARACRVSEGSGIFGRGRAGHLGRILARERSCRSSVRAELLGSVASKI